MRRHWTWFSSVMDSTELADGSHLYFCAGLIVVLLIRIQKAVVFRQSYYCINFSSATILSGFSKYRVAQSSFCDYNALFESQSRFDLLDEWFFTFCFPYDMD